MENYAKSIESETVVGIVTLNRHNVTIGIHKAVTRNFRFPAQF